MLRDYLRSNRNYVGHMIYRQDESRRFTWVSRDGTRTRVRDMHDAHLLNAVRLVRRVYSHAADRLSAERCGGHGFVPPTAEQLVSLHPTWAALQAELVERQLDELPVW